MSSAFISEEEEKKMKPIQICEVLIGELDLGVSKLDLEYADVKPKEVVKRAAEKLGLELDGNVKEQAMAIRAKLRMLPASFFWGGAAPEPELAEDGSEAGGTEKAQALLDMLLAKPASSGGFAAAVLAAGVKMQTAKGVDSHGVTSGGALMLDGQRVRSDGGMFDTVDNEALNLARLARSKRDSIRIGDLTFHVESREQPVPGTTLMMCKSMICKGRMACMLTPQFLIVGLYEFVSAEVDARTMAVFEEVRVAADAMC